MLIRKGSCAVSRPFSRLFSLVPGDPFPRGDSPESTHRVFNQSSPLVDHDWAMNDPAIRQPVEKHAPWHLDSLGRFSREVCSEEAQRQVVEANETVPRLLTHGPRGHRLDEARYHPSYHANIERAIRHGQHSIAWERGTDPDSPDAATSADVLVGGGPGEISGGSAGATSGDVGGRHVARGSIEMVSYGMSDPGMCCPVTMTFAAVPCLLHEPEVAREWVPRLLSREYDGRNVAGDPRAKRGAIVGMSMTEKQSGSDVRTNETFAARGGPLGHTLVGHKWFTSAPNSDAFLTLAVTEKGAPPTCFLVPRHVGGARNPFRLQRLKDKIGDRSNASSEVEYAGTHARIVGPEGRGVPVIAEMVNHTRLSCVLASAGLTRRAVTEAVNHTRGRAAFGAALGDQPLMRSVLADLALESEAMVALAMRLCEAYDTAPGGGAFGRVATAVAKYFVCKRSVAAIYESLECHGGNGYVEDFPMARLYRQAPLNSIWEGSGNVIALDILRAISKDKECITALLAELDPLRQRDPSFNAMLDGVSALLSSSDPSALARRARSLADTLGVALQAAALSRGGDDAVFGAFVQARIARQHHNYGSASFDNAAERVLIDRATVA